MSLTPGDKLGPYEILAPIGAGGMGEVYRARDPRLGRDVAIKVSAQQFTERFEREARAIAALNHPNICQIYDVGPNYLVMEYIEGMPLKGPLPVDQALKYAVQICDALDAAHKKGITHRDLKPANILVTKAGIKLLDFGLAKLGTSGLAQAAESPDDATLTMALTGKNEIVGTLYYMSPEQLKAQANGREIDARSDIFSFGLVLYEMITGKRAFEGSSPASVIAAIMERPAPSIADVAPPALDHALKTCLAKDPDERWQTARDLKRQLEWIASSPGEVNMVPAAAARHRLLPWIAAAVLAVVAGSLGIIAYRATRPAEPKPLVRLDIDLGPGVSLGSVAGADVILSPDGTRLVYVSQTRLFSQRLDQSKATELTETEGGYAPFFSPDGQWVAFFAGGKLKKISVNGGAAIALCDAPNGQGGSWGEDGNIVAGLTNLGALSRIPASGGGTPTGLTELAQGEVTHRWPQILPGGKAILFTSNAASAGFDGASIEVMSLVDRRRKTLQRGGTYGRYLPSGYLIYVSRGALFAVPFDIDRLEVRGTPAPVLEGVGYSTAFGSAQFDFSRAPSGPGTLVYRTGTSGGGLVTLQWLDSTGKSRPLLAKPGFYLRPRLSPDGQRLALGTTEGSSEDIWVYELQRDTMTRVTFGGAANILPLWSPDGQYILFRGELGMMFWTRSDGAGKPQPLIQKKNLESPWSFTPDGKRLAFLEYSAGTGWDLWTVPVESDGAGLRAGKPEVFLQTPADERYPSFSPDGRWLAYISDESGIYQVYVRAFPDKGGKWQISASGGTYPVWSRKGRELFFRGLDNRIMVASYTISGDAFLIDKPRLWSEKRLADYGRVGVGTYDLAPDGKRIVALMPAEGPEEQEAQNHVIFLENFSDELRRRAPAGGKN